MMLIGSWALFGVLALLWTGGAFITAELVQWGAQALGSGAAAEAGRELAQLPVPPWAAIWLDPAWVQSLQAMVLWGLDAFRDALPLLGSAAGWLVPVVWVLWFLGLVALLVAAGAAHVLLRRFVAPRLARA